jgi:hypothetical protein
MYRSSTYSIYDASIEEWTAILKQANQWAFDQLKEFAIRELNKLEIHPVQKIYIYQEYDVNRDHLREALTSLALRDEPITIEEGRKLGLDTALRLAHAREEIRSSSFGNGRRSGGNTRSGSAVKAELDTLICSIFQLTPASDGDEGQTTGR